MGGETVAHIVLPLLSTLQTRMHSVRFCEERATSSNCKPVLGQDHTALGRRRQLLVTPPLSHACLTLEYGSVSDSRYQLLDEVDDFADVIAETCSNRCSAVPCRGLHGPGRRHPPHPRSDVRVHAASCCARDDPGAAIDNGPRLRHEARLTSGTVYRGLQSGHRQRNQKLKSLPRHSLP